MTTEHYDDKTAAAFGKEFIEHLKPYPFGGMPKRDLDCLIFSLLKAHELIPGEMNRERAYSLGISESKYKSYLVDSDAKFGGERKPEESVKKIFEKLGKKEAGVSLEGDMLVFFEDDPVMREDFVQEMKAAGFYTDLSFNKELVKVKATSFLLYAHREGLLDDKEILDILNKDKSDKDKIKDISNAQMSLADFLKGGFDIAVKNGNNSITTIAEVFGFAADVAKSKLGKGNAKIDSAESVE